MQFIERMTPTPGEILEENEDIGDEWALYVKEEREKELNALIEEEKLRPEETRRFVEQAFSDGYVTTTGVAITKVLPPLPLFGGGAKGGSSREEKKERVLNKLTAFFNRYFNLSRNPNVEQVHTTQLYPSAEDVYHGKAAEAGGEG